LSDCFNYPPAIGPGFSLHAASRSGSETLVAACTEMIWEG
jgi:hypothetical protein